MPRRHPHHRWRQEGSVNFGIQRVQQQTIYVTQRSTNIIKEYRNYLCKKDQKTDRIAAERARRCLQPRPGCQPSAISDYPAGKSTSSASVPPSRLNLRDDGLQGMVRLGWCCHGCASTGCRPELAHHALGDCS